MIHWSLNAKTSDQVEKSLKKEQKFGYMCGLTLKWENSKIMYVEEFVSYDIHNFIGEVGGFFGLFLGFSFTSLFVVLEWIQRKVRGKNITFKSRI